MRRKGFTLIELLVVIAIIALLLSILLPSLEAVKKQARGLICRSNMRQIGLAAIFYAEDHETYIPRGGSNANIATGDYGTWFQLFLPYLDDEGNTGDYRDVKIYRCKSYPNKKQTVCYVVNSWTFYTGGPDGEEINEPTKLKTFRRPQYTVYLADNEDGDWRPIIEDENGPGLSWLDVFKPVHLPSSDVEGEQHARRVAKERHKKGSNYLFLDWHVEYIATDIPTDEMWKKYWRDAQ